MRRTLFALLLVVGACTATPDASVSTAAPTAPPTATPTAAPTPTPGPDASGFEVELAMQHVRALAVDIGNREAGKGGDDAAAAYMVDELVRAGLDARRQAFPLPQGGTSWNVIGAPRGLDVEAERYLIVGGHYDSLRGPGANDNATGTAAAMEIVRVLAERPAALPVIFVAFGAEEVQPVPGRVHHVGSRFYVDGMSADARANLVAMINLDMIGHGDVIILGHMNVGPDEATERLERIAKELDIVATTRQTRNWSDNGSFLTEGMNAGWLWSGDRPEIHSPRDTIDTVRPDDVERAGRLALATLRSYR